jgi:hypothetical protein
MPDRSAHPSGQGSDRADGSRPTGSISFGALRTIAAGMARVRQPVPVDDGSGNPRSLRLLATAFYDVWLVVWPDGAGLEPHDHGAVRSVLYVIEGELTEILCDRASRRDPFVRLLERGVPKSAEPTVVHALTNRSGREATTLHVYSPPLVPVAVADPEPAGLHEVGVGDPPRAGGLAPPRTWAGSTGPTLHGRPPLVPVKP